MGQQENPKPTDPTVQLEDLPVEGARQEQVKGGLTGTANGGVRKTAGGGRSL